MTEDELTQLDALDKAATSGPWIIETGNYTVQVVGGRAIGSIWICTTADTPDDIPIGKNDAAFIAAARVALPALISEVRKQRAELRDMIAFHPRAAKLMRKGKPFIVIADDEPYFKVAYEMLRAEEIRLGRWDQDDEELFSEMTSRAERSVRDGRST